MGILSAVVEKAGLDKLPGSKFVTDAVEGVVDGALVVAGPAGWAVLGAKTAAWAGLDPKTSMTEAFGRTALGIGLGAVGGKVVGAAMTRLGGTSAGTALSGLKNQALEKTGRVMPGIGEGGGPGVIHGASQRIDDAVNLVAKKADDVLSHSALWKGATSETGSLTRAHSGLMSIRDEKGAAAFKHLREIVATRPKEFERSRDGSIAQKIRDLIPSRASSASAAPASTSV